MSYVNEEGLSRYSSLVKKDLKTKADIDSPILTGTPEAPTPGSSATSTQIATVGYIDKSIDTVNTAVEKAQSTADSALTNAKNAQTAAESAQTTADSVLSVAEEAQRNAKDALDTVNDVYAIGESAENVANEAMKLASNLQGSIDDAISTANQAFTAAENAQNIAENIDSIANEALDNSNVAIETVNEVVTNVNNSIEGITDTVNNIKQYDNVGTVDLNEYYDKLYRIRIYGDSTNAPNEDSSETYFIDVDISDIGDSVRQIATSEVTCDVYVRNGFITNENDVPILEWTDWVLVGSDVFLPLKGGILDGNLDMGDGNEFTANGLKITSEGHIKLPSGIEFY